MGFVLDTSVLVSALRSQLGASSFLLKLAHQGRFLLLASPPLFLEYEEVLLRPDQRLVHGLSIKQVQGFLADLVDRIEPVEMYFQWRPQMSDPGDEMVLEAAINGRADALVMHNIRHFASAGPRFQIPVLTPKRALEEIAR